MNQDAIKQMLGTTLSPEHQAQLQRHQDALLRVQALLGGTLEHTIFRTPEEAREFINGMRTSKTLVPDGPPQFADGYWFVFYWELKT